MTDVLQSHSSRSVPVGFYLPPLHPCLVDLSLLLSRPVQYTVAQLSSLLGARDIEGWQLPIDRRVSYAFLAWFFTSHLWFRLLASIPGLPAFVGVVIITSPLDASCRLLTWLPRRSLLHHPRSSCLLWPRLPLLNTVAVRGIFVPVDFGHGDLQASYVACPHRSLLFGLRLPAQYHRCPRYLRPCRFWAKAFCRARVSP